MPRRKCASVSRGRWRWGHARGHGEDGAATGDGRDPNEIAPAPPRLSSAAASSHRAADPTAPPKGYRKVSTAGAPGAKLLLRGHTHHQSFPRLPHGSCHFEPIQRNLPHRKGLPFPYVELTCGGKMTKTRKMSAVTALGSLTAAVALLAGSPDAGAQPAQAGGGSFPGSFLVPGTNTSIKIGGFVKIVGIYDLDARNGDTIATDTIPMPTSTSTTHGLHGATRIHARQSNINVDT